MGQHQRDSRHRHQQAPHEGLRRFWENGVPLGVGYKQVGGDHEWEMGSTA